MYETVLIGEQLWMKENLKVTHYNNGDEISTGYSGSEWLWLNSGAYAIYDDNPQNAEIYGNLYNWYTVDDNRGVCPEGWHVPSDDEYKTLEMFLGMSESEANNSGWRGTNEGSKLAGNADLWNSGNLEQNAEFGTSGFNGFPAGIRNTSYGDFTIMGTDGYFWSSTESGSYDAWFRKLNYGFSEVFRSYYAKHSGFSIRCLRD